MIFIPIEYMSDPSLGMAALRVSQQQMYQVVSIGLFAVFILQNIWLSAFLIWALILYGIYGYAAPIGTVVLTILAGCLIYEAVYRIVDEKSVKLIFGFMIGFAVINMIYMTFQGMGWELIYQEFSTPGYQTQMLGFMGLKAIMGMFFAMALPFMAYKYPKLALGLFIPLYVSECSSAMVAGIIAYLWQIFFISKKWFSILLVVLCIGGAVYTIHDSHAGMFTDRFNMWKVALRDAALKPVLGWGPDSFRCITPDKQFMYWKNVRTNQTGKIDVKDTIEFDNTGKYDIKKYPFMNEKDIVYTKIDGRIYSKANLDPWDNPHNEYVQLFYEFGIVGVIIFGFLVWDMTQRFNFMDWNIIAIVGFFISVLVMSIGQFPFHLTRVGIYIPIFLGCYYKLTDSYVRSP